MGGYGAAMRAYARFEGRASRAEFWQFTLVTAAIIGVAYVVFGPRPGTPTSAWPVLLCLVLILIHVVPYVAVMARRLHDLDASGWWAVIGLIPVVGLVLLFPAALPGTPGSNRFGNDPSGSSLREQANARRGRTSPRVEPHIGPTTASEQRDDIVAQLEKLAQLKASGSLSDAEFALMKAQLLAQERGS